MSHRVWTTMPIKVRGGRKRAPRAKTFKTEESAKKWATENKLKDFSLEKIGLGNKVKVVSKQ